MKNNYTLIKGGRANDDIAIHYGEHEEKYR